MRPYHDSAMKARRLVWILIVIAAVTGAIAVYVHRNGKDAKPKYRTETVDRGAVAETVTATGTISAVTTVQVGSQVSGIVSRLYADYNSPVKKGQLVAELDPTPFEAQVAQRRADLAGAEVQMNNTEVAYKRSERLVDQGLTSQAEYDGARAAFESSKAQVDQAQAALRQATTNLSYTRIFSPIDGVVVARQYDIGQTVAASFQAPTLFTIAEDLTKMQVQADVDQSDIGRVQVGQTARFTVDAYADEPFSGKISQIRLNATVNQNVITYPVIIDVPNPDQKLKPKMTADVTIEVARVDDVLRVPNGALRFRPIETASSREGASAAAGAAPAGGAQQGRGAGGGGLARAGAALGAEQRPARRQQTVYLVLAGDQLKAVPVKTGISDGRYTAIVDGAISPGDKVAVGTATINVQQTGTFPGTGPGGGGRRF